VPRGTCCTARWDQRDARLVEEEWLAGVADFAPHRRIRQRHPGHPLEDHGDAVRRPDLGGESMGQRALQQRLLDRLQLRSATWGAAGRPTRPQRRGPIGLPAGMPAAGALAGDVQFANDLSLGAALQTVRRRAPPRPAAELAACGGWSTWRRHACTPAANRHPKVKGSIDSTKTLLCG
jgi:hypothetical protein